MDSRTEIWVLILAVLFAAWIGERNCRNSRVSRRREAKRIAEEGIEMFCHHCGRAIAMGASFCSNCGAPVDANQFSASPFGTLNRPRAHRVIAGVCAGLHLHYGWDLTALRILVVILGVVLFPLTEIAYVVAWMLIPEEPLPASPMDSTLPSHDPQSTN